MVLVIQLAKLDNSKVPEILPSGPILSRAFCDAVFITVLFVGKKNINKPIIICHERIHSPLVSKAFMYN